MSKHRRERRRRAADGLPPADSTPVSLAELGIRNIKEYGVATWCPTPDGSGPAEAVVLHLTLDTPAGDLRLGLRLKTPGAVDTMIAALERHRNDVWPDEPDR